jgi:hypothetical protein
LDGLVDTGLRVYALDPQMSVFLSRSACLSLFKDCGFTEVEDYSFGGCSDFSSMTVRSRDANSSLWLTKLKVYPELVESILNASRGSILQSAQFPIPVIGLGILESLWSEAPSHIRKEAEEAFELYLALLDELKRASVAVGNACRIEVRVNISQYPLAMSMLQSIHSQLGTNYEVILEKSIHVYQFASCLAGSLLQPMTKIVKTMTASSASEQCLFFVLAELLQTVMISKLSKSRRLPTAFSSLLNVHDSLSAVGYVSLAFSPAAIDLEAFDMDLGQFQALNGEGTRTTIDIDHLAMKNVAYSICPKRQFEIGCYLKAKINLIDKRWEQDDFWVVVGDFILDILSATWFQVLTASTVITTNKVQGERLWFNRGPFVARRMTSSFDLKPASIARFINKRLFGYYSKGQTFEVYCQSRCPKENKRKYFDEVLQSVGRSGYLDALSRELKKRAPEGEESSTVDFFIYRFLSELDRYSQVNHDLIVDATVAAYDRAGWVLAPRYKSDSFCVGSSGKGVPEFVLLVDDEIAASTETQIQSDLEIVLPPLYFPSFSGWREIEGVSPYPDSVVRQVTLYIKSKNGKELEDKSGKILRYVKKPRTTDAEKMLLSLYAMNNPGKSLEEMYCDPHSGLTRLINDNGPKLEVYRLYKSVKSLLDSLKKRVNGTRYTKMELIGALLDRTEASGSESIRSQIIDKRDFLWAGGIAQKKWWDLELKIDYSWFKMADE